MACYNFATHEQILVFFGRNVTHKAGNQITCASAPGERGKYENQFSLKCCTSRGRCSSWTVLHAQCCLPERKIFICDVFDSV